MKILHILHSLKYSGAEIMYVDAAPLFQERGCSLSVVATANELGEFAPQFVAAGYEVYHKPYPSLKHFVQRIRYIFHFITFLKQYDFDVVHIHSSKMMWVISLCAWIAGKKSIYTFHNVFPTRFITKPYHIFLRWSAKNLFQCTFQTISDSVYNNELTTFKNKTTKIDNWYSNDRYYPALENEKIEVRKELAIADDTFVIISIGGCSPIKRHDEIIKALELVIKEIPNILYLHLGQGTEEENEKKLTHDLKLENNILFLGNQKNVRKYLIASDLYIMPSKFEGIPITTIEAMGCEIPTLLYNVPGLKDFNKEAECAMLIEEDNKLLAQYLLDVYHRKIDLTPFISNAKHFVDLKYNVRKNNEKIYSLYIQ
jgi:glycosyltransferase involved in cell wall biosynthesis